MKKKMTEAEIKEAEELKKSRKKGAINIDIVVAIIVFGIYFATTIIVTRNYNTTLAEYSMKTNALNVCINRLNNARALSLNELANSSGSDEIDGINYGYNIAVTPYIKNGDETVSNAKIITSTVTYMISGNEETVSLKSIKVEND